MLVYVYLKYLWHSDWFWKFCTRKDTSGLCTATDQKVMLIERTSHDKVLECPLCSHVMEFRTEGTDFVSRLISPHNWIVDRFTV